MKLLNLILTRPSSKNEKDKKATTYEKGIRPIRQRQKGLKNFENKIFPIDKPTHVLNY